MKKKKAKLLAKLIKADKPHFIQNKDKSVNIPVNTMDCIRIF